MPHVNIKDFKENETYRGIYVCKEHSLRTTKTGSLMMNVTVTDNSGQINGSMFNVTPDMADKLQNGYFVFIDFNVQMYKGDKNIILNSAEIPQVINPDELKAVLPFAPVSGKTMYEKMYETADNFKNAELRDVVTTVLLENSENLKKFPAGKSMHHACIGGLAYHEGTMLELAKNIAATYSDDVLDKELLYAGVILHDIKKVEEFSLSKIGLVEDYSTKGKLLGHIVMGVNYISEVCDRLGISENTKLLLSHMMLSHHGDPEFGSPVRPMFIEAYLLNAIDNIDSRVYMYTDSIKNVPVGGFSERQFGLDNVQVYRHR